VFLSRIGCCTLIIFERGLFLCNHYTDLHGFVVGQLRVISEVIFCVESESELRIGPSRQDFEIFEVMYTKNGFFEYF